MKIVNIKKLFFKILFVIFIFTVIYFLITIKNNIKGFNRNFLDRYNSLYIKHLDKINNFEKISGNFPKENTTENLFFFPFEINIDNSREDSESQQRKLFSVEKDSKENIKVNILNFNKNNEKISEIFDSFKIIEKNISRYNKTNTTATNKTNINNKTMLSYNFLDQKINFFKHINIIYLTKINFSDTINFVENKNLLKQNILSYNKIILQEKKNQLNIYLKTAYIDKETNILDCKDLFKELNNYNSKYFFDEISDDKYLNIILANSEDFNNPKNLIEKKPKNFEILFNKDINNYIFYFDFKHFFDEKITGNLINFLISLKTLNLEDLKNISNNFNFETLVEFIKLENSNTVNFHRKLIKIISDLEKLNKFFVNYNSSKNIEFIKVKVKLIYKK